MIYETRTRHLSDSALGLQMEAAVAYQTGVQFLLKTLKMNGGVTKDDIWVKTS